MIWQQQMTRFQADDGLKNPNMANYKGTFALEKMVRLRRESKFFQLLKSWQKNPKLF
jgi:hypothetical protein